MSSSDDEVVVNQPKSKSGSLGGKRTNKKPRSSPSDDSEDSGAGSSKQPAKKQKLAKKTITNDDGSEMHEIGNNRFISVSMFKGKVFVNIREYYEKDGKLLPGKKGNFLNPRSVPQHEKSLVRD
ncbi:hypothetical protein M3Y97_00313800 [Aphelenchoides bicaudatus]|nr:hypothetical protein M3Y97_00313800 [Aphelenchoides bicaudatus]